MTTTTPLLLDQAAASERTGIPARKMRDLFQTRAFPTVKVGRRVYVTPEALSEYIAAQVRPANPGSIR